VKLASYWPRGRYNGRRITGFALKLRVDVASWWWCPRGEWGWGAPMVRWLCFTLLAEPQYHYLD
jgi:hypothetical protein